MCWCASSRLNGHPQCAVVRSLTLCSSLCSFSCVSLVLSSSTWTLSWTSSSMWPPSVQYPTGTPPTEESGPWPKSPLSQVMSPTSLTISTTHRQLKFSSRSNPATRYPCTCLTRNSTTRPSAERSLHHCSLRREKNQRTEDKLITLLKKVCCQLSPCLSVMQERWDPCMNFVRWVHAAEKNQVATQKMCKSGFFLDDKKSKFSQISEQRFTNTSPKPILIGEVFRNWMELSSLSEEKWITPLHLMNNFDEISNFFRSIIRTKSGSSWSSYEKSQWDGRIEAISRVHIRWIFEKEIDRSLRHYPWTHSQDSGTTEWS